MCRTRSLLEDITFVLNASCSVIGAGRCKERRLGRLTHGANISRCRGLYRQYSRFCEGTFCRAWWTACFPPPSWSSYQWWYISQPLEVDKSQPARHLSVLYFLFVFVLQLVDSKWNCYGHVLRYLLAFRENYFGEHVCRISREQFEAFGFNNLKRRNQTREAFEVLLFYFTCLSLSDFSI